MACLDAMFLDGHTTAADLLEERTGEPYKVVLRAMERACDRALTYYGGTLARSWPTKAGMNLIGEPLDRLEDGLDSIQRRPRI